MILIQVMAFWMKERTNKWNYDVHLLQALISIITEYILIELESVKLYVPLYFSIIL